jgi:hypothetical protein
MAKNIVRTERKAIDKVFILLGIAATVVLVVIGSLAWHGYRFATESVTNELTRQKIFFPAAGSTAISSLPEADRVQVEKYAGQQLVNGEQAKIYADNYINAHLKKIADGKTYAEVSGEAQKDPTNQKLQQQRTSLFQGETLRGLLLGSGYTFWTFGLIAKYAAMAAFIGAGVMALLVALGLLHLVRLK